MKKSLTAGIVALLIVLQVAVVCGTNAAKGETGEPSAPVTSVYAADFETDDSLSAMTIVDADGDGVAWKRYVSEEPNTECNGNAMVYSESKLLETGTDANPDNWLITEPIAFSSATSYLLGWYTRGAMGSDAKSDEHYTVYILPENYTELTQAIEIFNGVTTGEWAENSVENLDEYIAQLTGAKSFRIAFRHYDSAGKGQLYLDYIAVVQNAGGGIPSLPPEQKPELLLVGDVNLDSNVNTADAVAILRYSAGIAELSEKQLLVANTVADTTVNTGDAVAILKFCAGLSTGFGEIEYMPTPASGDTPPMPPSGGNMPPTPPSGGDMPPTPPSGGDMPPTPPSGGDMPPTPPSGGDMPPTPPSGGGMPPTRVG